MIKTENKPEVKDMKSMLKKALALLLAVGLALGGAVNAGLADTQSSREVKINPKPGTEPSVQAESYSLFIVPNVPEGYRKGNKLDAIEVIYTLSADDGKYAPDGSFNLESCYTGSQIACVGFSASAASKKVLFGIVGHGVKSYTSPGAPTSFSEADIRAMAGKTYYGVWSGGEASDLEDEPTEKVITVHANIPEAFRTKAEPASFQIVIKKDKPAQAGKDEYVLTPGASSALKGCFDSRISCKYFTPTLDDVEADCIRAVSVKYTWEQVLSMADEYYAQWNVPAGKKTTFSPGWAEGCYAGVAHPYPVKDHYPKISWKWNGSGYELTLPNPVSGDPLWVGYNSYGGRSDYKFLYWSTQRDDQKGGVYRAGDTLTTYVDSLYAVYEKTVRFHSNVAGMDDAVKTVGTFYRGSSDDKDKNSGYRLTFPELYDGFAPNAGYHFLGWCLNGDGTGTLYQPGDTATLRGESDYYAVWQVNADADYTVRYFVEGETGPRDEVVRHAPTGARVDASALAAEKEYPGFRYTGYTATGETVEPDGSTVVDLHYGRTYSVVYRYEGGAPEGAPEAPQPLENVLPGEAVSLDAASRKVDGFTWSGWSVESPAGLAAEDGKLQMPSSDVTVVGRFTADASKFEVQAVDGYYTGKEYTLEIKGLQRKDEAFLRIAGGDWQPVSRLTFRDAVDTTVDARVERGGLEIWRQENVPVHVRKRTLTYEVENAVYSYMGYNMPQAVGAVNTTEGAFENGYGLVKGEDVVINLDVNAEQTFVTNGPVAVGLDVETPFAPANEKTNLNNYEITVIPGSIEITPQRVELLLPYSAFQYNAANHEVALGDVIAKGFWPEVKGWSAAFASQADGTPCNVRRVPGDQTLALDLTTLSLTVDEGAALPEGVRLADQYTIVQQEGTLHVSGDAGAFSVTLTARDIETVYDGAPHEVDPGDAAAFTVEGLPEGVELSGIKAAASGRTAGRYPIVFEGEPVFLDTTTTPATDVSESFRVTTREGTLAIAKRPVRFVVGSVTHVYDGAEHSAAWAVVGVAEADGSVVGGLAAGDSVSAVLTGNARVDVGTSKVAFDKRATAILNGTEDVTSSYDIREWGTGSVVIVPAEAGYTVRYYYNGVEDGAETVYGTGQIGDIVSAYPTKARDGMRLERASGLPLTLDADAQRNVISVYYATRPEQELLVEVETPLAGSMMSVTAGDTAE